MPRGNGRGPLSGGRGMGRGAGNRQGVGPGGNCICPGCGTKIVHQAGTPCFSMSCPRCGIRMVRE